jgi:hypothetical protein
VKKLTIPALAATLMLGTAGAALAQQSSSNQTPTNPASATDRQLRGETPRGQMIDENQIAVELQKLGYSDIGGFSMVGTDYNVNARKDGKLMNLVVDGYSAAVKQQSPAMGTMGTSITR